MHQMDQFISILKLIEESSNMENLKESNKLKPNNNKQMKKDKRKISKILLFGKLQNQMSQNGHLHGEKEDLAGISNVLPWLSPF